jgi:poly-gamma-glutamate capsule biosynthesis protein CapA/YwtB (metallophosphatase superfamily)
MGVNTVLLFGGDVHTGQVEIHVSQELRDITSKADIVTINLETPFVDVGSQFKYSTPHGEKTGSFKSSSANVKALKDLGVDVACLANNHMCDFGCEGVENTIRVLEQNGICKVGAGNNIDEAERPIILSCKGIQIGFLAFSFQKIQAYPAGAGSFGCSVYDEKRTKSIIKELTHKVHAVIVQMHWGYTNYSYPTPEQIRIGRELIDAGATIVMGHHPHVIQGYEYYKKGLIVYSLGNLIFAPYQLNGRTVPLSRENHTSMMCLAEISMEKIESLEFVHTRQVDVCNEIRLIHIKKDKRRRHFLNKISKPLHSVKYAEFYRRYTFRRILLRAVRWFNPRMWSTVNKKHMIAVRIAMREIFK